MCIADVYKEREPLPALITFPLHAIESNDAESGQSHETKFSSGNMQDVMAFRWEQSSAGEPRTRSHRRDLRSDAPALVCSAGMWDAAIGQWTLHTHEREYCRVVKGRVRVADRRGRQWEFGTGRAFLLLRGFEGTIETLEPAQVAYIVFSLPEGGALDWCMVSEGRTALGQERIMSG